ncbi:tellurium resistance protein [Roseivivax halodurans JCM 10272]|uniref:ADP-ribose pyrophosphatase n=1 Tax=Roseivivax halodurans JCM 10272 TaxID=1449350 RepID=X7EHU1_9RHOB|nr:NUDIX domain-containing protein [Roseivivax halodurans]ETX15679.1 tellurium resistance protein [Roseivivax halodurans JCM 10272]
MTSLFVFGTLRHVPLLARVLGRPEDGIDAVPATCADHRAMTAEGEEFPILLPAAGEVAPGLLLPNLSENDVARIDHYEGVYGYALEPVRVGTEAGPADAQVYRPTDSLWQPGDPWDFETWRARWGEITTLAADEAMASFRTDQPGAPRFARMARAWSQLLARQGAPRDLRARLGMEAVDGPRWMPGFEGFFRLRRFALSHRTFSGGESPRVEREGFAAFDAALVLPYDPERDSLLVIEQLRYGPILRGDPFPWVLEPVAGLVDPGEDPVDTARREAVEEAHLHLGRLEKMLGVYASPGYSSEFFHCFLGIADLSGQDGTLGGAEEENEDIRSHVITFDRAMELIATGEINAGPLAMMIYWLGMNRDRLRALS